MDATIFTSITPGDERILKFSLTSAISYLYSNIIIIDQCWWKKKTPSFSFAFSSLAHSLTTHRRLGEIECLTSILSPVRMLMRSNDEPASRSLGKRIFSSLSFNNCETRSGKGKKRQRDDQCWSSIIEIMHVNCQSIGSVDRLRRSPKEKAMMKLIKINNALSLIEQMAMLLRDTNWVSWMKREEREKKLPLPFVLSDSNEGKERKPTMAARWKKNPFFLLRPLSSPCFFSASDFDHQSWFQCSRQFDRRLNKSNWSSFPQASFALERHRCIRRRRRPACAARSSSLHSAWKCSRVMIRNFASFRSASHFFVLGEFQFSIHPAWQIFDWKQHTPRTRTSGKGSVRVKQQQQMETLSPHRNALIYSVPMRAGANPSLTERRVSIDQSSTKNSLRVFLEMPSRSRSDWWRDEFIDVFLFTLHCLTE